MCRFEVFRFRIFLALILLPATALAQGDNADRPGDRPGDRLWLVGVALQADDESSRGSLLSLGTSIGESTWLSGLVAQTSSPVARANVSATTFAFGINHELERFGFSVDLETWGEQDAVESDDVSLGAYFQGDRVRVSFGLEKRDIDITLLLSQLNDRFRNRILPLTADGKWLGLRLFASQRIELFFNRKEYDYSRNLSGLPRVDALNLLSTSTLTLANSFVSELQTFGVDLSIGQLLLSIAYDTDKSAVDGTALNSMVTSLMVPVAPRLDIEISLGRSDSDLFSGGTWGGIAFLFYGGG